MMSEPYNRKRRDGIAHGGPETETNLEGAFAFADSAACYMRRYSAVWPNLSDRIGKWRHNVIGSLALNGGIAEQERSRA